MLSKQSTKSQRLGLTRDDLLIGLIEECSEVIKAATKCLRFGYDVAHDGVGYGNNAVVLSIETGDVLAIMWALPLDAAAQGQARATKLQRMADAKRKYGIKPVGYMREGLPGVDPLFVSCEPETPGAFPVYR